MDFSVVVGVIVGLALAWIALVALLWMLRPREVPLAELVRVVPDIARLCRDVLRDRHVPLGPRLAIVGLFVWLVNPIDLIPEFIPLLGPLDDVVVAVLVLRYVRGGSASTTCRSAGAGRQRASGCCGARWVEIRPSGCEMDRTCRPVRGADLGGARGLRQTLPR